MLIPGVVTFEDSWAKARWMTEQGIADARLPWVQFWSRAFLALPPSRRASAILEFCQVPISYVRDPRTEVLEDADAVLERGWGDCDAKVRLFIAICTACGVPARAHPVILDDGSFPHVLSDIYLAQWIPADPTIVNSTIGNVSPAGRAITNYW